MEASSNSTFNLTAVVNSTYQHSYSGSTVTFYVSVFLIWVPGTLSNILALGFIVNDMKKAVFPAIYLLFILCCCDLCAVLASWSYHILLRYVLATYSICAASSFMFTFFNISASVTNAIMAVDRVLAICYPFFYKKNIEVRTWKKVCLISAIIIGFYCVFPFAGLGDVMSKRGHAFTCNSFSYQSEPIKRAFGIVFGLIGVGCVLTILTGNMILFKTLLSLYRSVACVEPSHSTVNTSDSSQTPARATPFEIAFAKLMICLAAVYLICGAPMQVNDARMMSLLVINHIRTNL